MFHRSTTFKQQGITLLILAVIIVMASATFAVFQLSINDVKLKKLTNNQAVLKEAKEALMAYVISYPEAKVSATVRGPGYFPCPDLADVNGNFDGKSESGCNGSVTLGRYPWRTIGTADYRDSANERLWYAVSETFDNTGNPPPDVINVDTVGSISLRKSDGSLKNDARVNNGVIAIIIAPGAALTRVDGYTQNRNGNPNNEIDYLDNMNGEDNAVFEHNQDNGFIENNFSFNSNNLVFNDQVIAITYVELMPLIQKRVAAQMKKAINDFRNVLNCNFYPEPDSDRLPVDATEWSEPGCAAGFLPEWIKKEGWDNYYRYIKPDPANLPCDESCIQEL